MITYALICGGDSLESEISVVTYKKIKGELASSGVKTIDIYLSRDGIFYINDKKSIKKGVFIKEKGQCFFKTKFKKYYFDVILPLVHGKGVEDGTLGAYFDILKIPCMYSGVLNSSILQNKKYLKMALNNYDIPTCKGVDLSYSDFTAIDFDLEAFIDGFSFPLIVKPSNLGSSIGVNKADDLTSLLKALDEAFLYDNEVLIEECIKSLKEVNVALIGYKNDIIVSELETVCSKNEVLTFFDKYLLSKDKTTRIIPSDIDPQVKEVIINLAKKAYQKLSCFGVNRFDFFVDEENKQVYLNEINTIPGSLAYYLFVPLNINTKKMCEIIYEFYLKKYKDEVRLKSTYEEANKKDLLSKE